MKKRFSIKMLAAGLVSCLAFSFGVANLTAKAEDGATTDTTTTVTAQEVETFEMANGAGVRVRAEDATVPFAEVTGIRFSMYFNKTVYSDLVVDGNFNSEKYEVSITISDETGGRTWDYNATKIVEVSAKDANTTADVYAFRAVLAGFDKANYGTNLTATGFVTVKGEMETTTQVSNPQTRSVAQVASKAYLVPAEVAKDTKGDLLGYINGYLETNPDAFKFDNATVRTDDYRTATLNEQIGVNIPEGFGVVWTNSNGDAVEVNEETNEITLGEEYGVSELTAKIGNTPIATKVTYGEPAAWIVDETNYTTISNKDIGREYKAAADIPSSLGSEYTGNAVYFKGGTNSSFVVNNIYTKEELAKIALYYNRVTMWVAFDEVVSGGIYLYSTGFEGLAAPGQTNHNEANGNLNTWFSLTITMKQYITLLGENDYFQPWTNMYSECKTANSGICYYFGNIEFSFDSYIEKVDANSATAANAIIWNADARPSYVSKADWQAAGITGDYTGDAVKMTMYNHTYKIVNEYTVEQLKAISKKYNSVSMWFAVHLTTDGHVGYYDVEDPTTGVRTTFISSDVGNDVTATALGNKSVWRKYTISIDTYIALLRETGTRSDGQKGDWGKVYSSYCPLVRIWSSGASGALYVGDVFFENV